MPNEDDKSVAAEDMNKGSGTTSYTTGKSNATASATPSVGSFQPMVLNTSNNSRKRKRGLLARSTNVFLGDVGGGGGGATADSSSDGSSDDEEDHLHLIGSASMSPTAASVAATQRHLQQQQQQQQEQLKIQQEREVHDARSDVQNPASSVPTHATAAGSPAEGWRVKLYRLNSDGSWDDCGTGRIVCLYNTNSVKKTEAGGSDGNEHTSPSNAINANKGLTPQEEVYQQLAEPTLCMHSETSGSTILLRTRILLRDAYQRQGDNIITWCEPFFEESRPASTAGSGRDDSTTDGVDLALSFQDNAGCFDIWRQITHVQSKAADFFRERGLVMNSNRKGNKANTNANDNNPSHSTSGTTAQEHQQTHQQRQQHHDQPQSVTDMAQAVAAAHHASLQREQQHALWVNVASEANPHNPLLQDATGADIADGGNPSGNDPFREQDAEEVAVTMAAAAAAVYHNGGNPCTGGPESIVPTPVAIELPEPPTLANLEEVADRIAATQALPQRDSLTMYIAQNDCAYLLALLNLFQAAEAKSDYGALATLAACVKTILLLNDPTIIEFVIQNTGVYEQVCSSLEYDPDLRDKANHRWFLRERAKFRTVVLMEDEELVATIHRSFRVTYLRDTLLRPTMDESSLSCLSSLQTFTHADVVKGVTVPIQISKNNNSSNNSANEDQSHEIQKDDTVGESYLILVMRMLGKEIHQIAEMEWRALEEGPLPPRAESPEPTAVVVPTNSKTTTSWKQHLAPQDGSLQSRKARRRGCLCFFRELFNMVRTSLQQGDKDDFYAAIVNMEVDLRPPSAVNQPSENNENKNVGERGSVNILSLLSAILSDPSADVTEKGASLEIVGSIAMHDSSLIRRHCIEYHEVWKRSGAVSTLGSSSISAIFGSASSNSTSFRNTTRPIPNERIQVLFRTPANDLLASLLFLMAAETDAGILLQTMEIVRAILDTDMFGEHGPLGPFGSDENDGLPHSLHASVFGEPSHGGLGQSDSGEGGSDQSRFLTLWYEVYLNWLVAPFQYTVLFPTRRIPQSVSSNPSKSSLYRKIQSNMKLGILRDDKVLQFVQPCAIRGSFAVELLSFCVRAHVHRMKFYLLRSRVMGNVLKLLSRSGAPVSGDRCLKLSALRFLRQVLSVKDEHYHRHIIQHNLFSPVFEAFRANPVGDNLVSSAIVEMCDFIQSQNINSLIEYIVTKHFMDPGQEEKTLEEVSNPYVNTLRHIRQKYEELRNAQAGDNSLFVTTDSTSPGGSNTLERILRASSSGGSGGGILSEKALEDQRRFRRANADDSYFDSDDSDDMSQSSPPVGRRPQSPMTGQVDEVVDTGNPTGTATPFLTKAQILGEAGWSNILDTSPPKPPRKTVTSPNKPD